MNRRQFLQRCGHIGLLATAAGKAGGGPKPSDVKASGKGPEKKRE